MLCLRCAFFFPSIYWTERGKREEVVEYREGYKYVVCNGGLSSSVGVWSVLINKSCTSTPSAKCIENIRNLWGNI